MTVPGAAYVANFKRPTNEGWYLNCSATHHLANNMANTHVREEFKCSNHLIIGNGQVLAISDHLIISIGQGLAVTYISDGYFFIRIPMPHPFTHK